MSRTRRKDPIDHRAARVTSIIMPFLDDPILDLTDSPKEIRQAHMDRKKSRKPGRKAKVYLHKGEKAKLKAAVKRVEKGVKDPDETVIAPGKRTDVWRFN